MLYQREHSGEGVEVPAGRRWPRALRSEERRLIAVRNATWWQLERGGLTAVAIAEMFHFPARTVRHGVACAERLIKFRQMGDRDPDCIPYFGCRPWARIDTEFRDHPDPRNVNADGDPICPRCGDKIEPGNPHVCMCCHASGFDELLAQRLGRAVLDGTAPGPVPRSRLHRASKSSAAAHPPVFSQADRAELAETTQGWL
jgi:hypothetical protein